MKQIKRKSFTQKDRKNEVFIIMDLLEVKSISKTYGSGETAVRALKNVSFSVPKGEFLSLIHI